MNVRSRNDILHQWVGHWVISFKICPIRGVVTPLTQTLWQYRRHMTVSGSLLIPFNRCWQSHIFQSMEWNAVLTVNSIEYINVTLLLLIPIPGNSSCEYTR